MKLLCSLAAFSFALSILFPAPARGGELDGLKITATMTQVIGTFDTYGPVKVGDKFELDLGTLPKEKISFVHNTPGGSSPYIPLPGPLTVDKTQKFDAAISPPVIYISSAREAPPATLRIQISTDGLEKGKSVTVFFYMESNGRIVGMAEARAVFKTSGPPPRFFCAGIRAAG